MDGFVVGDGVTVMRDIAYLFGGFVDCLFDEVVVGPRRRAEFDCGCFILQELGEGGMLGYPTRNWRGEEGFGSIEGDCAFDRNVVGDAGGVTDGGTNGRGNDGVKVDKFRVEVDEYPVDA